MTTTKRKSNIVPVKEDKALSLLAESRLKEKVQKLTHAEVWGTVGKRI